MPLMTIQISALCGRLINRMNMLSFVIPVYNCKNYLPECIESIEKIGLSDYEILLIDNPMNLNEHLEIYLRFIGGQ